MTEKLSPPNAPAPARYRASGPRVVITRYGLSGRVPYDSVVATAPDLYGAIDLANWLNSIGVDSPARGRKVA